RDLIVTGVQTCALPIFGHRSGHPVSRERFPSLHPLVYISLEARQYGHHEEVPVEVAHRLLDDRYLELRVLVGCQQVGAHHGLVRSEERRVGKEWRGGWG